MAGGPNVYAITRTIWDDPDFAPEPFTEREAWIWLAGEAVWKDVRKRGNTGKPLDHKRGEFSYALSYLQKAWRWKSKAKVARFLKSLLERDTIRDASRDGFQVYSVKNYNRFQIVGLPSRDAERDDGETQIDTPARRERDEIEAGKQDNISSLRSDIAKPPAKKLRRSLPDEIPTARDREWAKTRWLQRGRADLCDAMTEEIEKFRDHHTAKDTRSADWSASWRTWVGNAMKFNNRPNGTTNGQSRKPRSAHEKHNEGTALFIASLGGDADGGGEGDAGDYAGQARLPLLAS